MEVGQPNNGTGREVTIGGKGVVEAQTFLPPIFNYIIMSKFFCYTDGACSLARNKGGIGIVIVKDGKKVYEFKKSFTNTTNNKCELMAVIYALNAISKPIEQMIIYSDSQYVIGCATKGWKRKKNVEYWALYDKVLEKAKKLCSDIQFIWVKGHETSSDFNSQMNNLADRLAVEASNEI